MIDITKDEFWAEETLDAVTQKEEKSSIGKTILKHKMLSIGLILFGVCIAANVVLICSFSKMIKLI